MIATLIIGLCFSIAMICYTFINWHSYSWIPLTVNMLACVLWIYMIAIHISRNNQVKDHKCDFCGGEVVKPKIQDGGIAIFETMQIFHVSACYKILQLCIHFPFFAHHSDMKICESCMTDFKEFVLRKKSYTGGSKNEANSKD